MYTCIDQICVEVFEKTIRGTELIDHSFERKFYGVWNGNRTEDLTPNEVC